MSRDFILVLGGGIVSLTTTLVVLFITDWVYRRDQARTKKELTAPERMSSDATVKEGKS
jgi:hypothetical protein